MNTPVVVHLGDENMVSMTVYANFDVASSEVLRVRHTVSPDPMDCAWITYQNFVLAQGVALMLSANFCTLTQVLSCLSDIYIEDRTCQKGKKTQMAVKWEPYRVRPELSKFR